MPPINIPMPVNKLIFPGSFSGAKTSVRMNLLQAIRLEILTWPKTNLENEDSFGSFNLRCWGWGIYAGWAEGAERRVIVEFVVLVSSEDVFLVGRVQTQPYVSEIMHLAHNKRFHHSDQLLSSQGIFTEQLVSSYKPVVLPAACLSSISGGCRREPDARQPSAQDLPTVSREICLAKIKCLVDFLWVVATHWSTGISESLNTHFKLSVQSLA